MTKVVTVVEIGTNDVKCHSYDSLINKTFYFDRKDIFTIVYKNGKVDTLSKPAVTSLTNLFFDKSAPSKIVNYNNRLFYQNTQITFGECKKIVTDRAILTNDPNLIKQLAKYNDNKVRQKKTSVLGIVLCAVGLEALSLAAIASLFEDEAANGGFIVSGLSFAGGVTAFISSGQINKQKKKDYLAVIEDYNNTYK